MSCVVDKGWMTFSRKSATYIQGVRSFIQFIRKNGGENTLFSCPCVVCKNAKGLKPIDVIDYHLLKHGILLTYTSWIFHGETLVVGKKKDNVENVAENACHPGIKQEDCVLFCENENTPEVVRSREDNKRKGEINYQYNDTSGRKPHSLVKVELEAKNPGVEITPSVVWLATHQHAGGNILPSAQPYYEKLQKAEEEIKEQQDTGTLVSPIDALTKAFGSDSRGRVCGVGDVSRTQYDYSAAARAKVAEMKSKDGDLKQEVKNLGDKMVFMIEGLGTLCNIVKDMKSGQGSSSYNVDSSQGSPSTSASVSVPAPAGQLTSPTQILLSFQDLSPARSTTVGAATRTVATTTRCSLLNLDGETIVVGTLCTGALGAVCHGSLVSPNNVKVLLDQILLPDESTIKANKLARNFQDVGVGGYVVHPKIVRRVDMFLKISAII